MALPLVADLGGRHAAGAGADVGGAVLLTCVVQVAGLGRVKTVILLAWCLFAWQRGSEREEKSGEGGRRKSRREGNKEREEGREERETREVGETFILQGIFSVNSINL